MNNKITFPRLSAMLADKSGRSKRFSEDFLREFFSLISDRLEAGESVKIKGFGTFRLLRVEPRKSVDVTTGDAIEISRHSKVVFIPAKELATAVNSPFEAFAAIEIGDDVDISRIFNEEGIEMLNNAGETYDPEMKKTDSSKDGISSENVQQATGLLGKDEFVIVQAENEEFKTPYNNAEERPSPDDTPESYINEDSENNHDTEETESYDVYPEERKAKWKKGLMISLVAAICALFATIAIWYFFAGNNFNGMLNEIFGKTASLYKSNYSEEDLTTGKDKQILEQTESQQPLLPEDSVTDSAKNIVSESEVPTAPSDPVVYDTISTTRYLTTMAKAHYGNYNLWPFIYEENKGKLGHPDRIRPGTPVVIPKLSKYGIDASNPADIDKAKKMGVEIYARYGKSI